MRELEVVADVPCRTGEGPLWHAREKCVYWMDIPNGRLFRLARDSSVERVLHGPVLGGATIQRDGGLALFGIHGAVLTWKTGRMSERRSETDGVRGTRFNDAIADARGRVLSGTMPTRDRKSELHLFETDGTSRIVVRGLGQSNGMAFSADDRTLFHVDTVDRMVRAYPYDVDSGSVGDPRVVVTFAEDAGVPDGMALDEEGCLWVAMWDGGCVLRLDAQGREVDRIELPVPQVSSVAFGGEDLRDLYVTTAGGDDRRGNGALAGSLFRARVEVAGLERHPSALPV